MEKVQPLSCYPVRARGRFVVPGVFQWFYATCGKITRRRPGSTNRVADRSDFSHPPFWEGRRGIGCVFLLGRGVLERELRQQSSSQICVCGVEHTRTHTRQHLPHHTPHTPRHSATPRHHHHLPHHHHHHHHTHTHTSPPLPHRQNTHTLQTHSTPHTPPPQTQQTHRQTHTVRQTHTDRDSQHNHKRV